MEELLKTLMKYGLISPNRNTILLFGIICLVLATVISPHENKLFLGTGIPKNVLLHHPALALLCLGLLLLVTYLVLLVTYCIGYRYKVRKYKQKYPLINIGYSFSLVSISEVAYLIDHTTKTVHWIENWTTATDLDFIGYWKVIKTDTIYTLRINQVLKNNQSSEKLLKNYSFGEGIRTREVPGSGLIGN